ncbi:MAG: hypothetical protein LUC94_05875 [Clostridiales bacterium]|nr:hypothetical protein [Clostridiales bacterium]
MTGIPIEQLPLSGRTCKALHRSSIHCVNDLLAASLENISRERSIGEKTLQEIEQVISLLANGEIELVEDDIEELKQSFSEEQLSEMSRYSILELKLSETPLTILCRAGYETLDKVACLSEEDYQRFKRLSKRATKETINAMNGWLEEKGFLYFTRERKRGGISEMSLGTYREIADALTPIFQVNCYQLYMLISKAGLNRDIKVGEDRISLDYNIRIVMELQEIQKMLHTFWAQNMTDGMIEINEAKKALSILQVPFDIQIVIESSCKNSIICECRNYYLEMKETFDKYFANSCDMKSRNIQIISKRISGMSLREIGDAYGITGERARQLSAKEIIRFPLLFEDYFAEPFEYFNIPKSKFIRLFPEISQKGYEYISMRHRKGKAELCEDKLTEYTGRWKDRLSEFLREEGGQFYKLADQ